MNRNGLHALAGIAAACSAASGASVTLHFELDGDPLVFSEIGYTDEPVTWTVFASFTGYADNSAYFGGVVGSFFPVLGPGHGVLGSVTNLTTLMAGEGTPAAGNGAAVEDINIFHSALLQTDDASNPIAIFSFDLTVDGVTGVADPDDPVWLTYAPEGVASVFPDSGIFSLPDEFTQINVISDRLRVPGPGVPGVLALGSLGFTLGRRRDARYPRPRSTAGLMARPAHEKREGGGMHGKTRLTAVVGLAAGLCVASASAQSVTLHFSADASELNVGGSIGWTVSASFTGYSDPSAYFGGFVGDFFAANVGDHLASDFENRMGGAGTTPTANDGDVSGINVFSSALLQTDDPANPIDFFEFRTTLVEILPGSTRFIEFDAEGVASVFASSFIFELPDEYTDFAVSSDRVTYFPAPGSLAALGGAGLALSRRRRVG
jgi:hypothetical protein